MSAGGPQVARQGKHTNERNTYNYEFCFHDLDFYLERCSKNIILELQKKMEEAEQA